MLSVISFSYMLLYGSTNTEKIKKQFTGYPFLYLTLHSVKTVYAS